MQHFDKSSKSPEYRTTIPDAIRGALLVDIGKHLKSGKNVDAKEIVDGLLTKEENSKFLMYLDKNVIRRMLVEEAEKLLSSGATIEVGMSRRTKSLSGLPALKAAESAEEMGEVLLRHSLVVISQVRGRTSELVAAITCVEPYGDNDRKYLKPFHGHRESQNPHLEQGSLWVYPGMIGSAIVTVMHGVDDPERNSLVKIHRVASETTDKPGEFLKFALGSDSAKMLADSLNAHILGAEDSPVQLRLDPEMKEIVQPPNGPQPKEPSYGSMGYYRRGKG